MIQALDNTHSELTKHSGLHPGGDPENPSWHEQIARPLLTRHKLFGPHGDGSHGFDGGKAKKIHGNNNRFSFRVHGVTYELLVPVYKK